MSITRRSFLKALLGAAATGAISTTLPIADLLKEEEAAAAAAVSKPIVFDLTSEAAAGQWHRISIVAGKDGVVTYVNAKRVDEIIGISTAVTADSISIKEDLNEAFLLSFDKEKFNFTGDFNMVEFDYVPNTTSEAEVFKNAMVYIDKGNLWSSSARGIQLSS